MQHHAGLQKESNDICVPHRDVNGGNWFTSMQRGEFIGSFASQRPNGGTWGITSSGCMRTVLYTGKRIISIASCKQCFFVAMWKSECHLLVNCPQLG
jgi:hypothetical protein